MIGLPGHTRIWIVAGVTDLRRGFTGLSALVQTKLEEDPLGEQAAESLCGLQIGRVVGERPEEIAGNVLGHELAQLSSQGRGTLAHRKVHEPTIRQSL